MSFSGEYSPTENDGSEEEMASDDSYRKKKTNAKRKVTRTVERLVMNVSDTKYSVVKFVAKKIFKWKL